MPCNFITNFVVLQDDFDQDDFFLAADDEGDGGGEVGAGGGRGKTALSEAEEQDNTEQDGGKRGDTPEGEVEDEDGGAAAAADDLSKWLAQQRKTAAAAGLPSDSKGRERQQQQGQGRKQWESTKASHWAEGQPWKQQQQRAGRAGGDRGRGRGRHEGHASAMGRGSAAGREGFKGGVGAGRGASRGGRGAGRFSQGRVQWQGNQKEQLLGRGEQQQAVKTGGILPSQGKRVVFGDEGAVVHKVDAANTGGMEKGPGRSWDKPTGDLGRENKAGGAAIPSRSRDGSRRGPAKIGTPVVEKQPVRTRAEGGRKRRKKGKGKDD
jgi:hypothetical protein